MMENQQCQWYLEESDDHLEPQRTKRPGYEVQPDPVLQQILPVTWPYPHTVEPPSLRPLYPARSPRSHPPLVLLQEA